MSTTSADRENMYKDYLQKELEHAFMMSTPVKKVNGYDYCLLLVGKFIPPFQYFPRHGVCPR